MSYKEPEAQTALRMFGNALSELMKMKASLPYEPVRKALVLMKESNPALIDYLARLFNDVNAPPAASDPRAQRKVDLDEGKQFVTTFASLPGTVLPFCGNLDCVQTIHAAYLAGRESMSAQVGVGAPAKTETVGKDTNYTFGYPAYVTWQDAEAAAKKYGVPFEFNCWLDEKYAYFQRHQRKITREEVAQRLRTVGVVTRTSLDFKQLISDILKMCSAYHGDDCRCAECKTHA